MTNRPILTSTVLASAFALVLLAGCGQKPEQMVASAKEYLAKNDVNAAIIQLKSALQENPDLAEARVLLGKAQLEAGDLAAAEKDLRRALELKAPIDAVAPPLAETLLRLGHPKKVIDEFASVTIADKVAMSALKATLGRAYLATGNGEAAAAAFAAALAANPDNARAILGQAYVKVAARDTAGALALVDTAIGKDAKLVEARQLKGELLSIQGQPDAAIAAYREALAIREDHLPAHAAIISQLVQAGKNDDAGKQLDAMAKVAPKHPQTLYMKAMLAYRQKQFAAARDAIQSVLQVLPDYLPALQLAGAIDYELKSYALAQANLQKVLHRAPNAGFARRVLVATYLRQAQPAKALDTLKPLLEASSNDSGLLALAGETYLANGDAAEAARYFEEAAKLDPKNSAARTAVALSHLATGDPNRAFQELEQVAAGDSGIKADLALIAASMRSRDFARALAAIDALEKKQPNNPMAQNLRGAVMLAKRDVGEARKSFEKAVSLDQGYLPAAANLARLDAAEKKPGEAKKRFEAVLEKDPKNVQALLAIAELRAREGAPADEVAGLIGKAIAVDPKAVPPRLALVGLHLRNNDARKAVAAAQDGLTAIPDDPQMMLALGRAQEAAGEIDAALNTLGRLVQQQPTSPLPLLAIAEVQARANKADAAKQSLQKALAIKPDLVEAQVAMIRLEIGAGKPKDALAQAKQIQKQRPNNALGFLLEGDIQASQKAWKESVAAYRAALKLAPESTDVAIKLHAAQVASGAGPEAEKFAAQWTKDHPADIGFRRYLAEFAMVRKDLAGSLAQYRSALAIEPNNAALLNNAAWVAHRLKDPKALEYAEQANKLVPDNPAIMDTLGVILVDKGDTARGLELLKRAADGAPKSPGIHLNYARALLQMGQKDAAKKELQVVQAFGDKFAGHAEVKKLLEGL